MVSGRPSLSEETALLLPSHVRISKVDGLNIVATPGSSAEERPVKERQITQENYRYDVRFVSAQTLCVCAEIFVKCAEIRSHAAPVSIGK